jgi:predicted  nucleic acid-binding Zn-ribbon protein
MTTKPRTPERQALAEAIEKLNDATTHIERLTQARERLNNQVIEINGKIDEAQREKAQGAGAIEAAKTARVFALADGDEPAEDAAESIEARIKRLEGERTKLRAARAEADEILETRKSALTLKRITVTGALKAVVSSSPEVKAHFDKCRAMYRAAALAAEELDSITLFLGPEFNAPLCIPSGDIAIPSPAWRETVERLKVDPDAQFPSAVEG